MSAAVIVGDCLEVLLQGYLEGDGHWDESNGRWRLGFTRNYNLERDLRTACARLGYTLTLRLSEASFDGKLWPTFRGELRMSRTGHHNERDMGEIVEIRKSRCREVYDLGVEDEPHLFALASGVLTHNSKPNPMPESVTDRPTKAHEYVFLLAKSKRYWYDADAIAETAEQPKRNRSDRIGGASHEERQQHSEGSVFRGSATRNKRTVWTIATQPYKGAHFATYPETLVTPCILAGCQVGGTVLDPFTGSGTTGAVAVNLGRNFVGIELNEKYAALARRRIGQAQPPLELEVSCG